jgi:hypothetical protein
LTTVAAVALDYGKKAIVDTAASAQARRAAPRASGSVPDAGPWARFRGRLRAAVRDRRVHCVIISEVLEHLHEDERALRGCRACCARSGVLAVSVLRTGPETVCGLSHRYRNTPGGHMRIYLRATIQAAHALRYRIFAEKPPRTRCTRRSGGSSA